MINNFRLGISNNIQSHETIVLSILSKILLTPLRFFRQVKGWPINESSILLVEARISIREIEKGAPPISSLVELNSLKFPKIMCDKLIDLLKE